MFLFYAGKINFPSHCIHLGPLQLHHTLPICVAACWWCPGLGLQDMPIPTVTCLRCHLLYLSRISSSPVFARRYSSQENDFHPCSKCRTCYAVLFELPSVVQYLLHYCRRSVSFLQFPLNSELRLPFSGDGGPAVFRMTPILGILIGIVGVLVLSAVVIVVALRRCSGARRQVRTGPTGWGAAVSFCHVTQMAGTPAWVWCGKKGSREARSFIGFTYALS